MFPDFVTVYRDRNNKVHLFFFPGMDEQSNQIYKSLDLSKTGLSFEHLTYSDGAEEFVFHREDISKVTCKLVSNDGNLKTVELSV